MQNQPICKLSIYTIKALQAFLVLLVKELLHDTWPSKQTLVFIILFKIYVT